MLLVQLNDTKMQAGGSYLSPLERQYSQEKLDPNGSSTPNSSTLVKLSLIK